MISESLTQALISYTYAQSWNGELPTVMSGSENSMVPVLDVNQLLPEETVPNEE